MVPNAQVWRESLRQQFSFHFHETRRLMEMALSLPTEVIDARDPYSRGGIRSTFEHILDSDGYWRGVLSKEQVEGSSGTESPSNRLEALIGLIEKERANWEQFLREIDDEWLRTEVQMVLTFGTYRLAPGQAMQHLILHGQVHHGEIAQLLTEAGLAPGDVDFFDYVAHKV